MPSLTVAPALRSITDAIPNTNIGDFGSFSQRIIIGATSYPRIMPTILTQSAYSLPASGDITLLAIAAGTVARITKIIFHAGQAQNFTFRAGTTELLRLLPQVNVVHTFDFGDDGIIWGASGDDINMHNLTAVIISGNVNFYGEIITL